MTIVEYVILYWIVIGILCDICGMIVDLVLFHQKPSKKLTMHIIPIFLGPVALWFLAKSVYYGLKK